MWIEQYPNSKRSDVIIHQISSFYLKSCAPAHDYSIFEDIRDVIVAAQMQNSKL